MNPRSFFSVAALSVLGLVGCSGDLTAPGGPSQANPLDAEENAVVFQLNMLRAAHNPPAPAVKVCASLDVSASAHSDDLRDHSSLALGQTGSDGSTVKERACTAGYKPACPGGTGGTPAMAEVVASGNALGANTIQQWAADPTAGPLILNPSLIVVGVGRSMNVNGYDWTMDMASMTDASCAM